MFQSIFTAGFALFKTAWHNILLTGLNLTSARGVFGGDGAPVQRSFVKGQSELYFFVINRRQMTGSAFQSPQLGSGYSRDFNCPGSFVRS